MSKKFISSNKCIHTKQVYSLIDLTPVDINYQNLSNHLAICTICKNELKIFTLNNRSLNVYIPKIVMDRDLKQVFVREVDDLFKVMNLDGLELFKKNVQSRFQFMNRAGTELMQIILSKKIIKTYIFGIFLFLLLKNFLN